MAVMLSVRLLVYLPDDAQHVAQLRPTSWSASLVHNAPGEGAMELEIAKPAPGELLDRGAAWALRGDVEVAVEVNAGRTGDGFVEVPNGRFLLVQEQHDLITRASSAIRARLLPYAWLLTKARVWTGANTVEPGRRRFSGTVGAIWSQLMSEAQSRGALSTLTCRATATQDSAGRPWQQTTTQTLDVGQDYLAVLDQLVGAGLCDAYTLGRELVLLRPDSDNLGADPPVLRAGRELVAAPREVDGSALATHAIALGDQGVAVPVDSAALETTAWGRWETSLSVSGVTDPDVIAARARSALNLWASDRISTSAELSLSPDGALPWRDYGLGGWVQVAAGDGPAEVHQVRSLALQQPQTGPMTASLELGRRRIIPERRMQRRLAQLSPAAMGDHGAGRVAIPAGAAPRILHTQATANLPTTTTHTDIPGMVLNVTTTRPGAVVDVRIVVDVIVSTGIPDSLQNVNARLVVNDANQAPLAVVPAATSNTRLTAMQQYVLTFATPGTHELKVSAAQSTAGISARVVGGASTNMVATVYDLPL